jgi:hypothetical protein
MVKLPNRATAQTIAVNDFIIFLLLLFWKWTDSFALLFGIALLAGFSLFGGFDAAFMGAFLAGGFGLLAAGLIGASQTHTGQQSQGTGNCG